MRLAGRLSERCSALIAGLWAGILLCIGAIAAPAAFAMLARPDAGRFVSRLFEQEAYVAIAVAVLRALWRATTTSRALASTTGAVASVMMRATRTAGRMLGGVAVLGGMT